MSISETTIEVDLQAADILRRVAERARARGETLGAYLSHTLPPEAIGPHRATSQREAWESFVSGMTSWSKTHLPAGYVADDSRDAAYGDRS
jgi:hypothetical protein